MTEPTEWVSSIVIVKKPNSEKLRICIDPTDLNILYILGNSYTYQILDHGHETIPTLVPPIPPSFSSKKD